jgi:methionyl aminopeptidase
MILAPGIVFTIEPMINGGNHEIFIDEDNGWTTFSADGSLSAQGEHTILVTEDIFEYVVTSKPISLDIGYYSLQLKYLIIQV